MNGPPGCLGTRASLALRLGQGVSAVGSLLFMCLDVLPHWGLVIPWSMTLALVVCLKLQSTRQAGLMWVIVVGDWILSLMGLAAAGSVAGLTDFLITNNSPFCRQGNNLCRRYQFAAAMTFFSWSLSFASSLLNLWLLPSLSNN